MNQKEALIEMRLGNKISHFNFPDDNFLYLNGKIITDEIGLEWSTRLNHKFRHPSFKEGWRVIGRYEALPTPPLTQKKKGK